MIKAIFFDFDGTISDAHKIVSESMFWLLKKEKYIFSKKKLNSLIGDKLEKIVSGLNLDGDVNYLRREFYKEANRRLDKTKLKLCVPIKPLENLKKNYLLLVISNNESEFIKKSANNLGVSQLFKEILGSKGVKTKDMIMKRLFKKYKLKSNEVIYVGDRFSDIDYARKAGCYAVSIHNKYSWSTRKVILQHKPDFIIKDFKELEKVVEKINKK